MRSMGVEFTQILIFRSCIQKEASRSCRRHADGAEFMPDANCYSGQGLESEV